MNRKQFALVLLALAIVGSAGLVLLKRNEQSWTLRQARVGEKVLPGFPYNSVASIHVKGSAADFNVVRKDGIWRIPERADYPASYPQLKELLLRMRDLKVVQSDTLGPSQFARVELNDPGKSNGTGTLLELKDGTGKLITSFIVGERHLRAQTQSDPFRLKGLFDGCYVRLLSDPENVLLISDDLPAVSPDPTAWLDKTFPKIDHIKSVSLVGTNGATLWTLLRPAESQPWTLADADPSAGEVVDPAAASQVVEVLPFLTFADVLPPKAASDGLAKPLMIMVETFDQFIYTLRVSPSAKEGKYLVGISTRASIPAAAENELELKNKLEKEQELNAWVFLLESTTIQPVLRERAQLLQKKLASSK